jgi:hypothetical protein
MDSALNEDASNVEEISFVGLKRLDSDRQTLTWMSNNVVATEFDVREIEH